MLFLQNTVQQMFANFPFFCKEDGTRKIKNLTNVGFVFVMQTRRGHKCSWLTTGCLCSMIFSNAVYSICQNAVWRSVHVERLSLQVHLRTVVKVKYCPRFEIKNRATVPTVRMSSLYLTSRYRDIMYPVPSPPTSHESLLSHE